MSSTSSYATRLHQRLGTAQRAAEVAAALTKFGFGEFLLKTGLDRFTSQREVDGEVIDSGTPLPVRVRLLLEHLGPTFIKGGQILSTRADLVPHEWIVELKKLQSNVPPDPWDGENGIKAMLDDELGPALDRNFASIEETAFAAASMAQVHRAVLKDGRHVVLKILRPGVRELMAADLDLMQLLTRLFETYLQNAGFDTERVVEEFRRELVRETDLSIEARSVARMARDFEDYEGITFPEVYPEISTRSVLAMEEIHGTLLSSLDPGTLTAEQRESIVRNGAEAVFRQCLVIGFFHADPHPGNIFVLDGERVCFVDCGMTGLVDPGTIAQLAQLVHGTLKGDLNLVLRVAIELSNADPKIADDRSVRADVWQFVDRFNQGTLESICMGALLNDFFAILRRYKLRCPADIVYLIKALTTIEGVATDIAPQFDLISFVRPYVERLIKQRYSFGALKERVQDAAVAYSDLIEELPGDVNEIVQMLRQNRLGLQLDHRGLDRLTNEMEHASINVSWSLVISAIVVGASVLVLADNLDREPSYLSTLAILAFISAITLGAMRMVHSRWQRRANRKKEHRR